jgi:hypothetical protein
MAGYGPNPWLLEEIETALPGSRSRYLQSRQAQSALPVEFSTTAQRWMVIASVVLICVMIPIKWQRHRLSNRLRGLCVVITFAVIANALITGVLSNVDDRYQSRVVWLLPLLAGVLLFESLDRGSEPTSRRQRAQSFVIGTPPPSGSCTCSNTQLSGRFSGRQRTNFVPWRNRPPEK